MERYCIEQIDTGLYYNNGHWCKEPEAFNADDIAELMRQIEERESSPLAIRVLQIDSTENGKH
jgi:hypothetical protein